MADINDTTYLSKNKLLHKIWKFKQLTPFVSAMGMKNIKFLDLTKKDTLIFFIDDNKENPNIQPYKIVKDAIVLQDQKNGSFIEYIISELTDNELKLIVHVTFTALGKEKTSRDLCQLTFEAQ